MACFNSHSKRLSRLHPSRIQTLSLKRGLMSQRSLMQFLEDTVSEAAYQKCDSR